MDPVASTAHWVAASRALESNRPDALFRDPYAAELVGPELEDWPPSADAAFGHAYIALRTRFFDDELLRAVREGGIGQVVILAAGMDARAYRLPFPAETRIFELDRPEVLAFKEERLAARGARPRGRRVSLGADLTLPWEEALVGAGFSPRERSAWLVEGLLMYLAEPDVRRLLQRVAALAAPGSTLALDVAAEAALTASPFADAVEQLRERGIFWRFACEDPAALLDAYGFAATSFTLDALAARYGRPLPWLPPPGGEAALRAFTVTATRRPADRA
jgi:methyltransferase (TIGR00027 family)